MTTENTRHVTGDDTGVGSSASTLDISRLVAALDSPDRMERLRARADLTAIGQPAAPRIVAALAVARGRSRWELVKVLTALADAQDAAVLTSLLTDDDPGIRWLAAEGLASIRCDGLRAVLWALVHCPDSSWVREGAHHVLRQAARAGFRSIATPVLRALDGVEPGLSAILTAQTALESVLISDKCGKAA
jgi:hypothetical protein